MLLADLYYRRIDVVRYLPQPGPECRDCDAASCRSFAARLEDGRLAEEAHSGPLAPEDCPWLTPDRLHAFRIALAPEALLPAVEVSQLPRPVEAGLVSTGPRDPAAPVLVSTNHEGTVAFLGALFGLASSPIDYLVVDARGDSVDMSMILGSLTPERVLGALDAADLAPSPSRRLVLPGFAAPHAAPIASASRWDVTVGPICGAEIPLFLGDTWRAA